MMPTTPLMVAHRLESLGEEGSVRPLDCSFSCLIVYTKIAAVDKAFQQGRQNKFSWPFFFNNRPNKLHILFPICVNAH